MSFIDAIEKTAGDVIDMRAWKSQHPLHKVKRVAKATSSKMKSGGRALLPYAAVGAASLLYGAGMGAEGHRRYWEGKSLHKGALREFKADQKKKKK